MNIIDKLILEMGLSDAPIKDYTAYFSGMKKGASDKLFFLNKIRPDLVVDFGSADGYVLSQIHELNPNIFLVGYDISSEMLKISRGQHPNIHFTNTWKDIPNLVKQYKNSCLLLSSVIHEVYSYSSKDAVDTFWDEIFNSGFEYIVIRDTIPSVNLEMVKNFKKDVETIKPKVDPILLSDYESKWGPIDKDYKNFIRFLLMYRYKDNWDRERHEDYMPLNYNALLQKISKKYKIIYNKEFKFKPIERAFSKEYGINLRGKTHLKMILRKS